MFFGILCVDNWLINYFWFPNGHEKLHILGACSVRFGICYFHRNDTNKLDY